MARLTPAQIYLLEDLEEEVIADPHCPWNEWFHIEKGEMRTVEALIRKGKLEYDDSSHCIRLTSDPRERLR